MMQRDGRIEAGRYAARGGCAAARCSGPFFGFSFWVGREDRIRVCVCGHGCACAGVCVLLEMDAEWDM